ncbi:ATP-binding protein [Pseudomonas putida]|uniref:ATP-binding protein n=1 Tax=Pseudomonas putida TaxID=303 RepID=UPI0015FD513B|nr:ATP-binding protein [Pseudomonas putida]
MNNYYEADYQPTGLIDYDDNPLIEALPPILDDDNATLALIKKPPLPSKAELELPAKLRLHAVNRLRDVVLPLVVHLEIEEEFSQLIRRGYTNRNPFARNTVAMRHAVNLADVSKTGFCSSANNMTVIGLSGMGKTTALKAVCSLYPQVIQHNKYKEHLFIQTQVVWLKLECPHDGSMRGFCAAFFEALDNALGVEEYGQLALSRASIDILLQHIGRLCRTYYVGAIVIDELQHLIANSGGKEKLLNFFVTLTNSAGVPLVYVGTNAMLELFTSVVRNARRASSMALVSLDRFNKDDANWLTLAHSLWTYSWMRTPTPLSDELLDKLYEHSQGNVDFLVKLLTLTQKLAISEELETIEPALIERVYTQHMRLLHRPIMALKNGEPKELLAFDDLMPAKDMIAEMMNIDFSRKIRRANLSHLLNESQNKRPFTTPSSAQAKEKNHLSAVQNDEVSIAKDLAKSSDLRADLAALGWTKSQLHPPE